MLLIVHCPLFVVSWLLVAALTTHWRTLVHLVRLGVQRTLRARNA